MTNLNHSHGFLFRFNDEKNAPCGTRFPRPELQLVEFEFGAPSAIFWSEPKTLRPVSQCLQGLTKFVEPSFCELVSFIQLGLVSVKLMVDGFLRFDRKSNLETHNWWRCRMRSITVSIFSPRSPAAYDSIASRNLMSMRCSSASWESSSNCSTDITTNAALPFCVRTFGLPFSMTCWVCSLVFRANSVRLKIPVFRSNLIADY